jgi:hypothetical protein|eukprot:SAG25_NODE_269_length_10643_cov_3.370982_6_plen_145_part_00
MSVFSVALKTDTCGGKFRQSADKLDWIGIFKEGSIVDPSTALKYQTTHTGSGTLQVTPPTSGKYYVAMFDGGDNEKAKRLHITVDDGTAAYDNSVGYVTPEVIQLSTNTIGRIRYHTYELAAILDTKRTKNLCECYNATIIAIV